MAAPVPDAAEDPAAGQAGTQLFTYVPGTLDAEGAGDLRDYLGQHINACSNVRQMQVRPPSA